MVKGLWNIAIKVHDLPAAVDFFTNLLGAEKKIESVVLGSHYVLLRLGDSRLILMDKAPYEKDLGLNLPEGFLHSVYEVDDFESHFDLLLKQGATILLGPTIVEGEFGKRKIAFFESPGKVRTEIMQILYDSGKS